MTPNIEVPTIYEDDYRQVIAILDPLKDAHFTILGQDLDAFVLNMEVGVHNKHGYPVGTLIYEDEQWRFTPHADWAND